MSIVNKQVTSTYEHPLNERVRLFLRLELIYAQASEYKKVSDVYEAQMCFNTLFALMNISKRYELRSEILKELIRMKNMFVSAQKHDSVDKSKIRELLVEIDSCINGLHNLNSSRILSVQDDEFLNTIKLRNIHDTGTYFFEIPELQFWLLQSEDNKQHQINNWLEPFSSFYNSIKFILKMIRTSAEAKEQCAKSGMFLKTTGKDLATHQLLRVKVDSFLNVYPQISGGKYRFSIRFIERPRLGKNILQVTKDVNFELQTCIL